MKLNVLQVLFGISLDRLDDSFPDTKLPQFCVWEGEKMREKAHEIFSTWNLKEIITAIHMHHKEISQIYLFGSRSYKTNSLRSDIDLLAITDMPIADVDINAWLHDEYPPVDLFCSYDSIVAKSVTNGSCISFNPKNPRGYKDLPDQLDAKLLWTKEADFSNQYSDWDQRTLNGIDFPMSIIPSLPVTNSSEMVNKALASLEASGIKTYYAGSSLPDISQSIIKLIEVGLQKPNQYQKKAQKFSFNGITIENEYDFQNLIHFLLRPVFPDIISEPFEIQIDGNKKYADFALIHSKIVIEAKWIDTVSKKADVLKTIKGLSDFYTQNSNIGSLIVVVLYKNSIPLDSVLLDYQFSFEKITPPIYVRFFKSDYSG